MHSFVPLENLSGCKSDSERRHLLTESPLCCLLPLVEPSVLTQNTCLLCRIRRHKKDNGDPAARQSIHCRPLRNLESHPVSKPTILWVRRGRGAISACTAQLLESHICLKFSRWFTHSPLRIFALILRLIINISTSGAISEPNLMWNPAIARRELGNAHVLLFQCSLVLPEITGESSSTDALRVECVSGLAFKARHFL